ncbi:unnamed protein product [Candida verbasci]|uniref:Semialdehyde dehydrogenase NAD-binding domain-containing protein n=1 Tax=Candida verbasci TaxID=1227364 RepID=A0A9W4U0D7_9ASCO|nr:unnamed protein product [Candida verbasci]
MNKIFITGATGYIGGEIIYQLLSHGGFEITALIRNEAKADKLPGGIKKVVGTLDDSPLLKKMVNENDIIINAANVDHWQSAKAISEALIASKEKKILIHNSGAAVLNDHLSKTKGPSTTIYKDDDLSAMESLPDSQPHKKIDNLILSLHEKNPLIQTAIISPSTVFGKSDGYDKKMSIQIPSLIKSSIKHGQAFTVYSGNYVWSHIHIKDLGELYYIVLKKMIADEPIPKNEQGYYFGAYDDEVEKVKVEHTWKEVAETVAEGLNAKKVVDTPRIASLTPQQVVTLSNDKMSPHLWGSNSRCRGKNAYKIGWQPKHTKPNEFLKSIQHDVDNVVAAGSTIPVG